MKYPTNNSSPYPTHLKRRRRTRSLFSLKNLLTVSFITIIVTRAIAILHSIHFTTTINLSSDSFAIEFSTHDARHLRTRDELYFHDVETNTTPSQRITPSRSSSSSSSSTSSSTTTATLSSSNATSTLGVPDELPSTIPPTLAPDMNQRNNVALVGKMPTAIIPLMAEQLEQPAIPPPPQPPTTTTTEQTTAPMQSQTTSPDDNNNSNNAVISVPQQPHLSSSSNATSPEPVGPPLPSEEVVPPPIVPLASSTVVVDFAMDCKKLAPCHIVNDDTTDNITCVTFYAKRFWESVVPTHMIADLHYQHNHRPPNCWYETEMLTFTKIPNITTVPYKNAVCDGPIPSNIVYWHNFKVAGTTARHALGIYGFPNYESGKHIFSDQLRSLFPELTFDDFDVYLNYVDELKHSTYQQQQLNPNDHIGFTFVRSPVQRFLSGLEQIERHNDPEWEVSEEARHCFDIDDAVVKVECVVDTIHMTRIFFNVHIYPQAYLFDTWTKEGTYDMAFTVLDLKDMDLLFKRFKGKIIRRVRESTTEGMKLNLKDKQLPPHLLVKICELYQVDLLLLQTLHMPDELCMNALSATTS